MSSEKDKDTHKAKTGFSFTRLALFLLMMVLISGVALYAFMGINPADILADGFSGIYNRVFTLGKAELSEKVKTIAEYESNARLSCAAISDDLAVADISSVKIYDSEGREKAYVPVSLQKPYIQVYKKDVLIADLEGRYFSLLNDGRLLWEKNIDEDIVNAGLSENWIFLITKSEQSGYKRSIRAYSKDGLEVSFRNVSDYYPFDVSLYPEFDDTAFIVNGLEASGITSTGIFEFLDPKMDQKASIRGENEIFARGFPIGKENLFLYGEKSLLLIDNGFSTIWDKKLTGSVATAAGVINDKYPVVAELNTKVLSIESRNETTIRILNHDSGEKAKLVIDDKVTGISTKGKTAAVQAGSEVFFINAAGDIMDRYTSKSNITGVYMAKDDLAYVLSSGIITRVNVKAGHKFFGIF